MCIRDSLVAHVGEKLRLGRVRRFGGIFRFGQIRVAPNEAIGQCFQHLHHRLHFVPRVGADAATGEFHGRCLGLPAQGPQGIQQPAEQQKAEQHAHQHDRQGVESRALAGLGQQLVCLLYTSRCV